MKALLAFTALLAASPAAAQTLAPRRDAAPVALAVEKAFGPAFWAEVKLSTSGPVADMTRLSRQGFYKVELIELVLLSARSLRPLKTLAEKRRKGASLSELALSHRQDPERLHGTALAVAEIVDRDYLPRWPERRLRYERDE